MGKKCRAFRGCKLCGAGSYNRHRFSRRAFATGTLSRVRPYAVKVCGLFWRVRHSLTVMSRPIHSGGETGGPSFAAVIDGQTGNSGAIPGRPRRCIQAFEVGCYQAIATKAVEPCGSREGMQPAELGSQKTYQLS